MTIIDTFEVSLARVTMTNKDNMSDSHIDSATSYAYNDAIYVRSEALKEVDMKVFDTKEVVMMEVDIKECDMRQVDVKEVVIDEEDMKESNVKKDNMKQVDVKKVVMDEEVTKESYVKKDNMKQVDVKEAVVDEEDTKEAYMKKGSPLWRYNATKYYGDTVDAVKENFRMILPSKVNSVNSKLTDEDERMMDKIQWGSVSGSTTPIPKTVIRTFASKAFRVFNSRTKIVEENLHIKFSESTPNVVGSGPNWLFDIDVLTRTMNYEPIIAGTQSNSFADLKRSQDDRSKPSSDDGKKVDEDPIQLNAAGTNKANADGRIISSELPFDPNMPALEDVGIDFSRDDEDDDAVADMNNLDTTIKVSPILTTRIHKDHPLDQVIRDLHSATQTRKTSKNLEEHGFVSTIQQRTNHKDLQNCLFACFLSHEEPKKSAFIYGKIKKEVYVCQPPGFEDPDFLEKVYKVKKALYGLHQAPRAWLSKEKCYFGDGNVA
nr:ribonuclease H-like domain-containing protein [Tanacetum cinerariifolium]